MLRHVCLLDRMCWDHWWHYGMPMRVHTDKHMWTIWPFTGAWRSRRIRGEPVQLVEPPES